MDTEDRQQQQYQEEEPPLCVKGCGFYGCPENLNMCSECYHDHKKLQEIEDMCSKCYCDYYEKYQPEIAALLSKLDIKGNDDVGTACSTDAIEEGTGQAAANVVAVPRCVRCNKKVSMYGFKCRCGSLCCSRHRYPEEHGCTFDFKTAGRISLAKANLLVKPDKFQDRII